MTSMIVTPFQVRAVIEQRRWLASGGPSQCGNCGYPIDLRSPDTWAVCRGWAEHTRCHLADPDEEDVERQITTDEAELQAYRDERALPGPDRTGPARAPVTGSG